MWAVKALYPGYFHSQCMNYSDLGRIFSIHRRDPKSDHRSTFPWAFTHLGCRHLGGRLQSGLACNTMACNIAVLIRALVRIDHTNVGTWGYRRGSLMVHTVDGRNLACSCTP